MTDEPNEFSDIASQLVRPVEERYVHGKGELAKSEAEWKFIQESISEPYRWGH